MASSQAVNRPKTPAFEDARDASVRLLKECHLIDFANGGQAGAYFIKPRAAQEDHSFFLARALDFRRGPPRDDHFADAIGKIEQLADRSTPAIPGAAALEAAGTFVKRNAVPFIRIQADFFELIGGVVDWLFAMLANQADQALRQDAVQGRNEVVRLDAHVNKAADYVGNVVGVNRGENQVAGERRLDRDLRGFLVANFADHDFVGVMPQNGTQAARKREALLLVHRNLGDPAQLIFDRVFNGDEFVFIALDFVDGR